MRAEAGFSRHLNFRLFQQYLRIPAEDPGRFGSDSGYLVADPIGHQVRFSRP
jgi:hypothetical protein